MNEIPIDCLEPQKPPVMYSERSELPEPPVMADAPKMNQDREADNFISQG